MAVLSQTTRFPYTATGVTVYAYGCRILDADDLAVKVAGVLKTNNVDYTVSGVGNTNGGNVTFAVAPTIGVAIVLYRSTRFTRKTDYQTAGDFLAPTVNADFDRAMMALQDIVAGGVDFANVLRGPTGEVLNVLPVAADRATKLLGFDAQGQPSVVVGIDASSAAALDLSLRSAVSATAGAGQIGYSPSVAYSSGLGQFLNTIYNRTTAEIAAGVTPTVYTYTEGDIRRYGATTASSNNATAINAALLVSASGGRAAFIPPGTWTYTSTLNATLSCSMTGVGQASVLNPNGCHGITFTNQTTYAGSRIFRDFFITGTAATTFSGIYASMSAGSGNRITGVTFSNITILGFYYAANLRGLWDCTFHSIFVYQCFIGFYWLGQNIQCTVENAFIQRGTATGTGSSYGVLIDTTAGESSQSIRLHKVGVYQFDIGICGGLVLAFSIENCDVSECNTYGVQIVTHSGGVVVRDTWVQLASSGVAGVGLLISGVGAATYGKILLDGNHIRANTYYANSIGVQVGVNQHGVSITSNNIDAGWDIGYQNDGAVGTVFRHNTVLATTTARKLNSSCVDCSVGPDLIRGGVTLAFTGLTPAGLMFYARGSFTGSLTGMTAAVSPTVNWVADGREVRFGVSGTTTGTSNATTMTMTGLPAYLWPVTDQRLIPTVVDNGVDVYGQGRVAAATGLMTFFKDANSTAFTNTGTKGLDAMSAGWAYL